MPTWKQNRDPLYRGDAATVTRPTPASDPSIVRHILYLEGYGRETPYLSTTEDRSIAEQFAGRSGAVWRTDVPTCHAHDVHHISRRELLQCLTGSGKGDAKWSSPYEVMQARRYVEQHLEHLLDFRAVEDITDVIPRVLTREGR